MTETKSMIYADNAATAPLDSDAFEAMKPYLGQEFGNASQPYAFARKPKQALAWARSAIAACIGADDDEIFFSSGGTESDNWAIKGVFCPGSAHTAITSQTEHHAVLNAFKTMELFGCPAVYLPPDSGGIIAPGALARALTGGAKLVSIMTANNEIGAIAPIKALCAVSHDAGALFHTDAVQAVGHIPIDVSDLGIDMLSASAHKFNGPKGIGFLYIRKGTPLRPLIDGGAQESGMRAGTENVASIVGMAAALQKSCNLMHQTAEKLRAMDRIFTETLRRANIDFIRNGAPNRLPGIINISIRGASGEMLLHRLDLKGISISAGAACDSKNTQISHVLKAIGAPPDYAPGTVRISFGRCNAHEDAEAVADAVIRILKR